MQLWPTKNNTVFLSILCALKVLDPKYILEIGAGKSTRYLAEFAKERGAVMKSIEENSEWVSRVQNDLMLAQLDASLILNVPIENDWYAINQFQKILESEAKWDLIFIDGPASSGFGKRSSSTADELYKTLATTCPTFIIDDVHRRHNFDQLIRISSLQTKKKIIFLTYRADNTMPNALAISLDKNIAKHLMKILTKLDIEFQVDLEAGELLVHEA